MIFDIGPKSAQELADIIMNAGTVVWNGPVGVFEFDQFGSGTKTIATAIANTKAFTPAGKCAIPGADRLDVNLESPSAV